MYLINGIPLDNDARGWVVLRGGTSAFSGIVKRLTQVTVPGYDGYFRAPSSRMEQTLIFRMKTPLTGLESLLSLLDQPNLLVSKEGDATKNAPAELVSAIPSGQFPMDELIYLTVTLSVFGAAWRSVAATIFGPDTVSNPVQEFYLLDGISAPVRDMDVFIGGVIGQFDLRDSQGSWLKSTAAWSPNTTSTGVLYVGATGQTFVANTASPWVAVSDAGNLVDVSGDGGFKITPAFVNGNPDVRRGHLTLTTLTQTSATIRVRAKGAYSMQLGS